MSIVVVLNDGETYSELQGCRIINIDTLQSQEDIDVLVKEGYQAGKGQSVGELFLKSWREMFE